MSGFLQRLGWVQLPKNRSILLCVPRQEICRFAGSLLEELSREQPRTSFFVVAHGFDALRSLPASASAVRSLSFPMNTTPTSLLFLLLARVRLIVVFEHPFWIPGRLLAKAYDLGIPIVVVRCRLPDGDLSSRHLKRMAASVDWWEPVETSLGGKLARLGVDAKKIAPPNNDESRAVTSATMTAFRELAARRPPVRRPLQRLVAGSMQRPALRKLLGWRARRLESIEALRLELGSPRTIMCLGNGPSCEDPALDDLPYDSLFRVNYRWISRGRFTKADMVFTGQKRTLFSVHPRFFAFQTRRAEAQLVTHQIFNPLCRQMNYVTLERLGVLGGGDWDAVRPTNGATMIAAAVALRPKRLIIAGIDLFEDPAGAYPGDIATPNAYVPVHDPGIELNFILDTLARFEGEIIIIGDVLQGKWEEFKSNRGRIGQDPLPYQAAP
jgi:hypothetical protein